MLGLFAYKLDHPSALGTCTKLWRLSWNSQLIEKVSYEQARAFIIDRRIRNSGDPRSRPRWTAGSKDDETGCDSDNDGANHNAGSSDDPNSVSRHSNNPACQSAIAPTSTCQAATVAVTAWQGFTELRAVERSAEALLSAFPWRRPPLPVLRDGQPVRSERARPDCYWPQDLQVACCSVRGFDCVHC